MGDANAAGRKLAFVAGNSDYENLPDIEQAKPQAYLVAGALKGSGFEVFTSIDDERLAFDEKFNDFLRVIDGAELVLLYYAGHSVQIGEQDRIVPVDARVENAADLEPQTVALEELLQQIKRRTRLHIAIIEACRDDPFPEIDYTVGSSTLPTTPGCAKKSPAEGVLIMQASEPGNPVAGNSPFTDAFVSTAFLPEKDIHDALRKVRQDTIDQTDGGQVPYFVSALQESSLYLNGAAADNGESEVASSRSATPTKPDTKTAASKKTEAPAKKAAAKEKKPAKKAAAKVKKAEPAAVKVAARPDAIIYSYKVWRSGGLRSNFRARQNTPHGKLSCVATVDPWSGNENSGSRRCRWE